MTLEERIANTRLSAETGAKIVFTIYSIAVLVTISLFTYMCYVVGKYVNMLDGFNAYGPAGYIAFGFVVILVTVFMVLVMWGILMGIYEEAVKTYNDILWDMKRYE